MGGHALSPDQTTSISGHSIFVAHDAVIIDGTSTLPIPSWPTSGFNAAAFSGATTSAQQAAVTAGGHTITATRANDGNVLIGGTILSPGQVATISGTAVTAETSGVVVNGRTVFFLSTLTADSDSGSDSSSADVGAIFTLNGQTYTISNAPNGIVVKGTGLADGVGWSTATGVAGAGLTGTGVVQGNEADRRGWR